MAKRLPTKVPNVWPGVLGPIKVKYVKDLKDESGHMLWGWAIYTERIILLEAGMRGPGDQTHMWRVFFHEVGHFWMEETGLNAFIREPKEREVVVDAYATSRVAEMLKLR